MAWSRTLKADDELAEILGLRIDLPVKFLRDLLQRATDAVRARLALIAPAELQEEIQRVLKTIANKARGERPPMRDFSHAEGVVKRMKGLNELNDTAVTRFAEAKRFDEVAASLAILNNSAPTDMMARLLEGLRTDLILIPCKSAGLGWATVVAILCLGRSSTQSVGGLFRPRKSSAAHNHRHPHPGSNSGDI